MKRLLLLLALLAVPLAFATTEELTITSCSAAGCTVADLNTYDNISGMTVEKNQQQFVGMSALSRDIVIDSFSAFLSHSGDAGISGSWSVEFRSATDQTVWCTDSTPLAEPWTQVTLSPTGCSWTAARLQDLEVALTNNDAAQPDAAFIDFFNASVTYTLLPEIHNVTTSNVTTNSADVSWDTNNSANSTLEYGTTQSLGTTLTNATFAPSHLFSLSSLDSDTTYFYNVTSCTEDACETQGPFSFTTEAILPEIHNVTHSNVTTQSAEVGWDTNNSANASIEYGTSESLGTALTNSTLSTNHFFLLEGLSDDTTYFYNVTSCTGDGCETQGPFSFTTVALVYPEIHNVTHSNVTTNSADVSWDTNNSANATLEYGTTQALGTTLTNATLSTDHLFALEDLDSNTTYFYNVTSCTSDACETQGPFSFSTLEAFPPTIENRTHSVGETEANISWDTDRSADATLRYGTTTAYGTALTNATQATSHAFTVTGLQAATTYYYQAESCDELGCAKQQGQFKTAPPADRCAYRYIETGDDHEPGLLKEGDVVVLDCRLAAPIREREDLHVRALFQQLTLTRIVTTPRLLFGDEEVLYP